MSNVRVVEPKPAAQWPGRGAEKAADAPLRRIDLGEVPYPDALAMMARWVAERQRGAEGDRLFLLTHPPVITYGARTPSHELPGPGSPIPLVEVDRGGHATYHGPGQLIGYLVVDVRQLGPGDIVRRLENGLIRAMDALGFPAVRRDTPPGSPSLVGRLDARPPQARVDRHAHPGRGDEPRLRPEHRP